MQLSMNSSTGVIEQIGDSLGERQGCVIVEADEKTAAAITVALTQPLDTLLLNKDGVVTVQYDQAGHEATTERTAAADAERTTAAADLRDQAAADLTRLDEIAAKGADFDTKQAAAALADQAAVLGRVLRLLKAQGG